MVCRYRWALHLRQKLRAALEERFTLRVAGRGIRLRSTLKAG
jgi:hypothetical protein